MDQGHDLFRDPRGSGLIVAAAPPQPAMRMGGKPPVIIAGAHRSGTTLVVRLLERLGLFTGVRRDPNLTSFFFLRRNEWVLRCAGGSWDRPLDALNQLSSEAHLKEVCAALSGEVCSMRFVEYSGVASMLLKRGTRTDNRPWGWKDPRNTFTFDAWVSCFPGAKLVLIERNGVDVAQSLLRREQEVSSGGQGAAGFHPIQRGRTGHEPLLRGGPLEPYMTDSPRLGSWSGAFELWEEYVEAGHSLFERYRGPKLRVRFETLVEESTPTLEGLAGFCGLTPADREIDQARSMVEPARAFSFRRDPSLFERYEAVKGSRWMRTLGYSGIEAAARDGGPQG